MRGQYTTITKTIEESNKNNSDGKIWDGDESMNDKVGNKADK